VFARGRFYYLVSAVPANGNRVVGRLAATIVVDALAGRIAKVFVGADQASDGPLGAFLGGGGRGG